MQSVFYVDGRFVASGEATIPVTDLAILRGYGVFDYTRTYNQQPLLLEAHVKRLFRSAHAIGLEMPWTKDEIIDIIHETLRRNNHSESDIRVIVTGGDSPNNIIPAGAPRIAVMVTSLRVHPAHHYSEGVKVVAVNEDRYYAGVKALNYISAVRAKRQARSQGAYEALYLDDAGYVWEGATSNLFAFFGDTLWSPDDPKHVLQGITRDTVRDFARESYTIKSDPLPLNELYKADEVFITSTSNEVLPVAAVDDRVIGPPGARTRRLLQLYRDFAQQQTEG